MRISRRTLLAGAGVAAAAAALPGCQRGHAVLDVRAFGARGDGITDDARAIQAATAALRPHHTLYFPRGTYRFAERRPPGDAAVVVAGVSDVAVAFDPGAELVMDNLDPTTRTGTSHGLLVRGPSSRITLQNVTIRWAGDAQRSLGDGIRVLGSGGAPDAQVTGITLRDCVVRASPQAGVIMMGVSGIAVTGLQVADSRADGLHLNACRRATVDDFSAVDTGDDGLALVTYYSPESAFDEDAATFAFPSLTDWSNADVTVTDVRVSGGKANGVRIAGATRVAARDLNVTGVHAGAAVMVDSAEPGADVGWNYVASRGIRLDDVVATNCHMGIHLLARPGTAGDRRFTDFDVAVDGATLDGCENWSVRAESLTAPQVRGLRLQNCRITSVSTTGGNGGVGIGNARDISLADVSIRHAKEVAAFDTVNAGGLTVDRLSVRVNQP